MKKVIYYILATASFLMAAGCANDLNITPDGRISMKDVWGDQKKSEAYLNSCYGHQLSYGVHYFFYAMLDGLSDTYWDSDYTEGLMATSWYNGGLTPSSDPTAGWDSMYSSYWAGIRQCNVFLQNADKAALREVDKPRFKAEATVLRDFYYFELCRKYGPQPLTRESFTMDTDFSKLTRPGFQDVADFITQDVDQVLSVSQLPWRLTNDADRGRFTKAMAITLKCQAQLYAASPLWNPTNDPARWVKARDYAKDALAQLTANGYKLFYSAALGDASFDNYFLAWSDLNSDPRDRETIMEMKNDAGLYGGWFNTVNDFPSRSDEFKAGSCPTQELVDAFDMKSTGLPVIDPANRYSDDNHLQPNYVTGSGYDPLNPYVGRDPRFYATVLYNGAYCPGPDVTVQAYVGGKDEIRTTSRQYSFTGYYNKKFISENLPLNTANSGSWKKMRLAEIYLILAEAENEVNGPDQAVYDALNAIRSRVNMPNVKAGITSKEEMRAYIQKEWTTEFALEEQRFWNVRRWKILDKTDKLVTGMRITKNTDKTFNYARFVIGQRHSWDSKFLMFPIPVDEASILGNGGKQWQNPGW